MLSRLTIAATFLLPLWLSASPALVLAQGASPDRGAAAGATPSVRGMQIVAVVNGDAITNADVAARGKLFAIFSSIPVSQEVLVQLRPQIIQNLVDERLRQQEALRRHVIVRDAQIISAIRDIEARNNLPPNALQSRLAYDGVSLRTLLDQLRVEIGWGEVLRQHLGNDAAISAAEIAEQAQLQSEQSGRPEYWINEIFIPISNPARTADAQRLADTVVAQLRSGAPFHGVAAQFSQSQTALQGGERGWLALNQLDPEIAKIVPDMPPGAISRPMQVAGGFAIVRMRGKRVTGSAESVVLTLRQIFLPFPTNTTNPNQQTPAQGAVVERARQIAASVHSCAQMEQAHKVNNSPRPFDPGEEVNLAGIESPQLRQLLATLPLERATQPLISGDGVTMYMICSRERKLKATINNEAIRSQLLLERLEMASRKLQGDLRRRSNTELRTSGGA